MYARIATFEGVDMDAADRTMDQARERIEPIMRKLNGFQGYMELIDRSSGKATTVSFFDSEENMRAAEPTFDEEMPKQLGDLMEQWAGHRAAVERYEVVVDERSGT
jgi:allantoicase